MEVILLERVGKLGSVGDVVRVKDGFARNYLLPQMKVLRATKENKILFEERRAVIEQENNEKREKAQEFAKTLNGIIVAIIRQAGEDGRLFGSVTSRDIAQAIQEKGLEVKRESIVLINPIKAMGISAVRVTLHPEVSVTVNVNVARTETEANDAEREFLNPKKAAKTEAAPTSAEETVTADETPAE
jgi:large subunit ribosomal protein L9